MKVCSRFDTLDGFQEKVTVLIYVLPTYYRIIHLQDFKNVCGKGLSLYFNYYRGRDPDTLQHKVGKLSTEFRVHFLFRWLKLLPFFT